MKYKSSKVKAERDPKHKLRRKDKAARLEARYAVPLGKEKEVSIRRTAKKNSSKTAFGFSFSRITSIKNYLTQLQTTMVKLGSGKSGMKRSPLTIE